MTIKEILSRPDHVEMRRRIQQLHGIMQRHGDIHRYSGIDMVPEKDYIIAKERYNKAAEEYRESINAACAEAGLPPHIQRVVG